jgi:hypothetical protein
MTQYLMSVWHDGDYDPDFSSEEVQRDLARTGEYNDELIAAGAWVFAGGLHNASSATVLRPTDTGVSMTDGPYAESKEQMGGFWVIDVADLDTALDWGPPSRHRLWRAGGGAPVPRRLTSELDAISGPGPVAADRPTRSPTGRRAGRSVAYA